MNKILVLVNCQNGYCEEGVYDYKPSVIGPIIEAIKWADKVIDIRDSELLKPYSIEWNLQRDINKAKLEKCGLSSVNDFIQTDDKTDWSDIVNRVTCYLPFDPKYIDNFKHTIAVYGLGPDTARLAIMIKSMMPKVKVTSNMTSEGFRQLSEIVGLGLGFDND